MTKETKFRAWDELRKVMHYDFQYIKSGDDANDWIVFISDKHPLFSGTNPLTDPYFQQSFKITEFTGKQCQGVDVYDGDIFEFDKREWGGDDNIHVVEWNDVDGEWSWGGGCTGDMEWRKVIGNIFENPELIPAETV